MGKRTVQDDYVHLHTHSDASAFDGLGKPSEFVELAAEMGQPALSLTEHGSGRSIYAAAKAARDCSITYIPGVEMYLADDASLRGLSSLEKIGIKRKFSDPDEARRIIKEENARRKERDHITVWALDQSGLRNLYRLLHYSWNDGFHFKPRVDLKVLRRFSEGIAVSTGCPGGVITKPVRGGDVREAVSRMRELKDIFGDRLYVEVMPHVPDVSCVGLARKMVMLADKFDCRVLATQDAHYPGASDAVVQDALLCVHTKSRLSDADRFSFDTSDYWMKPRTEYIKAGLASDSSLKWGKFADNTVEFSERVTCQVEIDQPGKYLAAPELPSGIASYDEWLVRLCREGATSRGIRLSSAPAYMERLKYELREIHRRGFSAYFCVVWEVRSWARSDGILCGPGRGSGGGSLVNYLLHITDLDPIKYGLSFDRFLAPGRADLPDIDLDFSSADRQRVIDHVRCKYGDENVAHISTHITLGGRGTLRDLGRICSVPFADIEKVSSMIVSGGQAEEEKDEESLGTMLRSTKLGQEFAARYPDVAELCDRLEGQLRTVGVHAGGIVISSEALRDIIPMESTSGEDGRVAMTAYDMNGVEAAGCVKLDVLGLKTLLTCDLALRGSGLSPDSIDYEDDAVLQAFTEQRFGDVFQFDTPSARRVCHGFEFRSLHDIAAMTALNRPGPLKTGLVDQFIERHTARAAPPGPHPIYDDVFAGTYGVPVYQEQVIDLVKRLCGYSAEEADAFRKAVAKKKGLSDHHDPFIDGAVRSGMEAADAAKLFNQITGFAQYAFNKSHSYTYSALSFWTMWIKVHAAPHFYAASLDVRRGDTVKQLRICAEARDAGILIEPPDVNHSGHSFSVGTTPSGGARITGSISDIKGIGPKAAKSIVGAAPYADLSDFKARAGVNLGHFKALAKASAFRSVVDGRRPLVEHPEEAWRSGERPEGDEYKDAGEEALVVGTVWPIYRSLGGISRFSAQLEKVRGILGPHVCIPGDDDLEEPGGRMVMALPSKLNLYADKKTGGKSGRVIVVSSEGKELVLRMEADTAEFSSLFEGDDPMVVWTYLAARGQRHSIERAWAVDSLTQLAKTLASRTGKAIGSRLESLPPGKKVAVVGTLVRRRTHVDKRGNTMFTMGFKMGRDYVRVLVFSSRVADDVRGMRIGSTYGFQVETLDSGGLCMTPRGVQLAKA